MTRSFQPWKVAGSNPADCRAFYINLSTLNYPEEMLQHQTKLYWNVLRWIMVLIDLIDLGAETLPGPNIPKLSAAIKAKEYSIVLRIENLFITVLKCEKVSQMLQLLLQSWKETASLRKSRIKSVRKNDKKYKNDIPNRDWEAFVRRTAWWSTLRMLGREGDKCPGVYSSSDDRTSLTYRMFMHTSYIGSKVGGSGWPIRFYK